MEFFRIFILNENFMIIDNNSLNFIFIASYAIINLKQKFNLFIASTTTILLCSSEDPKTLSSGSSSVPPARSGSETQYVPLSQLLFLLYVVFTHCPVPARSPPEMGGIVIPCACYTSGNHLIKKKSDHRKTAIR